jgi:CRP-like cAMP-binding protein
MQLQTSASIAFASRARDAAGVLRQAARSAARTLEADETLLVEGAAAKSVFLVLSGTMRCYRMTRDGRRHICRFVGAGDLLGLGVAGAYRYSAEAVGDCEVLSFSASALQTAADSDHQVRQAVSNAMVSELLERERAGLRCTRMTAEERVADFLLELTETQTRSADGYCVIPMHRIDIADHLGLTLETVSRALNGLRRRQIIVLPDAHHFAVRNKAALLRLAEGDMEESADDDLEPIAPRGGRASQAAIMAAA